MGTGKSTYLMVVLFALSEKNITMVLPSRNLAKEIYKSVERAIKAISVNPEYKGLKLPKLGKGIDGVI